MELSPEAEAIIEALKAENALLRQRIAELERRLGLDSGNSSKPPSSDGLGKKPRIAGSLRGKSGKVSGGQKGHRGDTLRRTETPDIIRQHTAANCAHCRARLKASMVTSVEKRQVFDLPEPRMEVTEHQASVYACAACHGTTRAAFPDGVTSSVQYGERIKAAAIYLNHQQLIPEDRVADVMNDLFGATLLCPASIVTWGIKKAAELQPFVEHIAARVASAPVRHRRVGRSVSTPASRRTVRETLASYSSHQAYDDVYPRCQCTNNLRLLLAMFLIRRTACAFRLRKRLYFRFAHAIRVALTYAHTEAIASGVYFP